MYLFFDIDGVLNKESMWETEILRGRKRNREIERYRILHDEQAGYIILDDDPAEYETVTDKMYFTDSKTGLTEKDVRAICKKVKNGVRMKNTRDWIKSLRAETGKTQRAFAEYYEIPIRTLEDWERGISSPPGYVLRLLEYRIRMEALMKGKHEMDEKGGNSHGESDEEG